MEAVEQYKQVANDRDLTWEDVRWQHVGNPENVRAIAIVKRGKRPLITVQTASATHNPEIWQKMQPVLREWKIQKANGNKRVNHDKLKG